MVTVIVPAYNSCGYLGEAVESAAAQTHADMELLLIDDGSADSTPLLAHDLMSRHRFIKTIRNSANLGAASSRNLGLDRARGDFVAFLDADDAWLPDKLERQLALLKQTGADLCYTGYSFMDAESRPVRRPYKVPERAAFDGLLRENAIGLSTVLIRRGSIGPARMRTDYAHEDYVFWLELLKGGCKAVGISSPLTKYRIRRGSRSYSKRGAAKNRWDVYRRFLRLNRAMSARYFASYAARGIIKRYSRLYGL